MRVVDSSSGTAVPRDIDFGAKLLARCAAALEVLGPLRISEVCLPEPNPAPDRDAEFGLLTLDHRASGLYYAWLDGEQANLAQRFRAPELTGRLAIEIANLIERDSDADRSLAMAAINAITSALYARAGYRPEDANNSFAGMTLQAGDRLGMIGYFPPLVRRARALNIDVFVVERKARMAAEAPGVVISLDPAVLVGCNKVICTGATLLNNSLGRMLTHCDGAAEIGLVGPTVGCFPDDFFAAGVAVAAGSAVHDSARAARAVAAGLGLGDQLRRTMIRPESYPGFETLIKRAVAAAH